MKDGDGDDVVSQDIVAIFHASFHPTKGNIIDWSLKASDDLDLEGVEFSVLPSGLHLVEKDTVYFSHHTHSGLALFRRRPTLSQGHRGFRLSSIGILLASSPRPRPWVHLPSLQALADTVYASADGRVDDRVEEETTRMSEGGGRGGELTDAEWEPARVWFEKHKVQQDNSGGVGVWNGWSDELDGAYASIHTPTPHLPHLLRILGLSSLTLYKFILSRRRVLIFTLPPVEVACILAWISADICREHHMSIGSAQVDLLDHDHIMRKESPRVLGMVTLSDLDRLEHESKKGQGWIACTTDAIFLEKPSYYDLVIDLTTSTPSKSSRPTLYMSKPLPPSPNGKKKPSWKLETVRFTWSDLKLWTELDRILKLDASHTGHVHRRAPLPVDPAAVSSASTAKWTDAFQLYEDVCMLCATLWMGVGTWRSNSRASFSTASAAAGKGASAGQWGTVRLEGDNDWSLGGTHMRSLGMGIEGRKRVHEEEMGAAKMRNLGLGIEGRPTGSGGGSAVPKAIREESSSFKDSEDSEENGSEEAQFRLRNIRTTLALLQTFHAHTSFLLSQLHVILPPLSTPSAPATMSRKAVRSPTIQRFEYEDTELVVLSSKDLLSLELGVMSELDAKFVEWLAEAEGQAGEGSGRRVVVKRGWKELLGVVFGFG